MEEFIKSIKKIGESKTLVRVLYVLGFIIIAKIIFFAGIMVGFHKASFGNAWGENYNENFGMGHGAPRMMGIEKFGMMDYFPNAHGATGKILKIEGLTIIVQDKDSTEKVISVGTDTKIQKGRTDITIGDLMVDEFVVVVGTPNEKGVIEAKLIRLIPRPEFLK